MDIKEMPNLIQQVNEYAKTLLLSGVDPLAVAAAFNIVSVKIYKATLPPDGFNMIMAHLNKANQ